ECLCDRGAATTRRSVRDRRAERLSHEALHPLGSRVHGLDDREHPHDRVHRPRPDRKSTRLNSSHGSISYAVFCLKKKIKKVQIALLTALLVKSRWTIWQRSFGDYAGRVQQITRDNIIKLICTSIRFNYSRA